jgi:hypothetical protein
MKQYLEAVKKIVSNDDNKLCYQLLKDTYSKDELNMIERYCDKNPEYQYIADRLNSIKITMIVSRGI